MGQPTIPWSLEGPAERDIEGGEGEDKYRGASSNIHLPVNVSSTPPGPSLQDTTALIYLAVYTHSLSHTRFKTVS